MKVTVDIIEVTPKKAIEWLENLLDGQRPVRQSAVKQISEDMRLGNWRLSCDALVLVKGRLANGQHRLWGVVESDTKQPFLLMRTDDEELYRVIDAGIKRSVGDATGLRCGNQLAAIANLVLSYDKSLLTAFSKTKRPTRTEVIDFLEANTVDIEEANHATARLASGGQRVASRSITGAFLVIARRKHGEKADAFLHHLYSGDLPDSAVWDLRERLLKNRASTTKYPTNYLFALIIKVFNCFIKGTKLGTIKLQDGEAFPKIIEPTKEAK